MTAHRYTVEEQADGTHAVFNNGGFVRGGWKKHERSRAWEFACELMDNDEAAGVPVIRTDEDGNNVATGAEDDGRKFVGTIDLTPTWRQVAGVIIAGLENGTPEGKRLAREELYRMADLADAYVAEQKAKGANRG